MNLHNFIDHLRNGVQWRTTNCVPPTIPNNVIGTVQWHNHYNVGNVGLYCMLTDS